MTGNMVNFFRLPKAAVSKLAVAAALLLLMVAAGCAAQPTPAPLATPAATPLPPIGSGAGGTSSASGTVAPITSTQLSFISAGQVQTITVAMGDDVAAGDLLITGATGTNVADVQVLLLPG